MMIWMQLTLRELCKGKSLENMANIISLMVIIRHVNLSLNRLKRKLSRSLLYALWNALMRIVHKLQIVIKNNHILKGTIVKMKEIQTNLREMMIWISLLYYNLLTQNKNKLALNQFLNNRAKNSLLSPFHNNYSKRIILYLKHLFLKLAFASNLWINL